MGFILSGTFLLYILMTVYLVWETSHIFTNKILSITAMVAVAAVALIFPVFWIFHLRSGPAQPAPMEQYSVYIAAFFLNVVLLTLGARLTKYFGGGFLPLPSAPKAALIVLVLTGVILGIGNYLATHTTVRTAQIDLSGGKSQRTVKLVVFSDTHTGSSYFAADVARLAELVNAQNPDIVLAVGDIIDAPPRITKEQGIDKEFKKIKAPVYAVTGNHEYYNGAEACVEFMRECGFTVLLDEGKEVLPGLYLYGRRDVQAKRRGFPSKTLLLPQDKTCIVMDHTPSRIKEDAAQGAKFIVCGHTHNGQLFPFNLITRLMYTISQGRGRIDETEVLVSTGFGTWGPRLRTTCQSELWSITLIY